MKGKALKLQRQLGDFSQWEIIDAKYGKTFCECGTLIGKRYFIRNKITREETIIGSTCATKIGLRSQVTAFDKLMLIKEHPEVSLGYPLRELVLSSNFLTDDEREFVEKTNFKRTNWTEAQKEERIRLHTHIANNFKVE